MDSRDLQTILRQATSLNYPVGASCSNGSPEPDKSAPSVVGNVSVHKAEKAKAKKVVKKRSWKKPKGKPKRPLSAYNIFFARERESIILSTPAPPPNPTGAKRRKRRDRVVHGKIGFADLAKHIGTKWKSLDAISRKEFESLAALEKERYQKELDAWNSKQAATTEPEPVISDMSCGLIDNASDNGVNVAALSEKLQFKRELQAWCSVKDSKETKTMATHSFSNPKVSFPEFTPSLNSLTSKNFYDVSGHSKLEPIEIESKPMPLDTASMGDWLATTPQPSSMLSGCIGKSSLSLNNYAPSFTAAGSALGKEKFVSQLPSASFPLFPSHDQCTSEIISSPFMTTTKMTYDPLPVENNSAKDQALNADLKDFLTELGAKW